MTSTAREGLTRGRLTLLALLTGAALAPAIPLSQGCGGGSSPGSFGAAGDDAGGGNDDAAATGTTRRDASAGGGQGAFTDDDGGLAQASPCTAGVYAGKFSCNVALFGGLFSLPLNGPISYTFVQTESQSGEFTTLGIAPGARMQAADNFGDGIGADMQGTLDCATGKLTGTLVNGTFTIGGTLGPDGSSINNGKPIPFTGPLGGDYTVTGATPAIANGTMGPCTSADLGGDAGPVANCTWSASLEPDAGATAPMDAGGD